MLLRPLVGGNTKIVILLYNFLIKRIFSAEVGMESSRMEWLEGKNGI